MVAMNLHPLSQAEKQSPSAWLKTMPSPANATPTPTHTHAPPPTHTHSSTSKQNCQFIAPSWFVCSFLFPRWQADWHVSQWIYKELLIKLGNIWLILHLFLLWQISISSHLFCMFWFGGFQTETTSTSQHENEKSDTMKCNTQKNHFKLACKLPFQIWFINSFINDACRENWWAGS